MKKYDIRYARSAEKELEQLPAIMVQRIHKAILHLADNPRPLGSIKLKGFKDKHRIRVGDYRVLYEIHDAIVTVLVVQITHRKDAYR